MLVAIDFALVAKQIHLMEKIEIITPINELIDSTTCCVLNLFDC